MTKQSRRQARSPAAAIALVGDVHGHHDQMVRALLDWQARSGVSIDLIVALGDFQAFRDEGDMQCMACPPKYQRLGDFPAYYRGEKRFPAPLLFIGGNHEAYNLLDEIPDGGPVGPDCLYLGRRAAVSRLGLRIAALSGIYSPWTYERGRQPVDYDDPLVRGSRKLKKQSTYFVPEEVDALAESGPVDLLLLHDWPRGLAELAAPGTSAGEPRRGVGNPPARALLEKLKPRWLFCGHMHWHFRGEIPWPDGSTTTFVCLDRVNRPQGPFLAVLQSDGDGTWDLNGHFGT